VLECVRHALQDSHAAQRKEQEADIKRHQTEYDRLQGRIHAMCVDKLDSLVDAAFFERMSAVWRREQVACLSNIERLKAADQFYLEDGVRILELAKNARSLFDLQAPREKRRLLDFLLSNSIWKGGELHPSFKQPPEMIAERAMAAWRAVASRAASAAKTEIWQPRLDSNLGPLA
jgi:site-specific DNA recombinase